MRDAVFQQHRAREIEHKKTTIFEIVRGGVGLGFFSHCDGQSGDDRCAFGYNPVVVARYQERYGVDLLREDADPHKLYALHGEGFTEFVRGASQLVRAQGKRLVCTTRTDGIHGWGGPQAGSGIIGATIQPGDLRDGQTDLPLTAGFDLETEKWGEEKLVGGLLCYASYDGGVEAVGRLREEFGVPCYLWRKFTGWQGKVSGRSMKAYQAELQAMIDGAFDVYCLLIMQITDHPNF